MSNSDVQLWQQFQELAANGGNLSSAAIRCGRSKCHLLLRGASGEPILLLSSEMRSAPRAPISLKHIEIGFDISYEVVGSDVAAAESSSYCRLICNPASHLLHRSFIEFFDAVANAFDSALTSSDVDQAVDIWLEMFRKSHGAERNTVIGLWGELLIIHNCRDPEAFIDAWHIRPTDLFDFSFQEQRIEVKTTERSAREHEFALAQVRSGRAGDQIASILASSSAAGWSALDLGKTIAARVSPRHQQKLWQLILETLDQDSEATQLQTFDVQKAVESLLFVPASLIPAPNVSSLDAVFISNVRFIANISSLSQAPAL